MSGPDYELYEVRGVQFEFRRLADGRMQFTLWGMTESEIWATATAPEGGEPTVKPAYRHTFRCASDAYRVARAFVPVAIRAKNSTS